MAHCYSSLFGFPTTGLRFFTVYGPWGRPDMALFKFTRGILEGKEISVYNNGQMKRDFTYIDDIVEGIRRVLERPALGSARVYNIGHGSPVQLMDFIRAIEESTGRSAIMKMLPMQPGDVLTTWADTSALQNDYGYTPSTGIKEGVASFVGWYRKFYNI
jgi:UDP-glucuronate 4-epimerase